VPRGTDPRGDYYLASVQQKIWILWNQQMRGGTNQEVLVSFTILADGQVTDVRVLQSSGVFLFDQAAQRAINLAAPFTPLPKTYGTNRYTIQAVFKPTP
jgi:TonB family protein